MKKYILAFLLAAVIGLIGGLQGTAGSVYILTGLLFFDIVASQKMAAGTTLLYTSLPVTIGAAYEYYKRGDLDLKIAAILIPTGFIFAILGGRLNYLIPKQYTLYSIAIMMLMSSIFFFRKAYMTK